MLVRQVWAADSCLLGKAQSVASPDFVGAPMRPMRLEAHLRLPLAVPQLLPSTLIGSGRSVREAVACQPRGQVAMSFPFQNTYRFNFHAVLYTLQNLLHDRFVVGIRLVVPYAHHPPGIAIGIPADLDDPIVVLFPRLLHPVAVSTPRIQTAPGRRRGGVEGVSSEYYTTATHFSHSSSSTSIMSKYSCSRPPSHVLSKNAGLASKSGCEGSRASGGNRSSSLKSTEFSDGGFHFKLQRSDIRGGLFELPRFTTANSHELICARNVFRLGTRKDQAVVTMLELGYVDIQNLSNVIRELLLLGEDLKRQRLSPFGYPLERLFVRRNDPVP